MSINISNRRIIMTPALASGGGGGSLSFTWTDSQVLTGTPAPPASFAAASIGTASSDRVVVAGISWQGTSSPNMDITDVKIGGTSATQVAYSRPSAGSRGHGIWYLSVSAGGTAVVSVTYTNGFVDTLVLNVGIITGSATTSAPGGTGITTGAYPAGSTNVSVTVPANGVTVIDSFEDVAAAAAPVTTWTGTFSSSADKDQWAGLSGLLAGSMTHLTASSATVNLTNVTNSGGTWGWVGANFSP